jgi:hypothetical protein
MGTKIIVSTRYGTHLPCLIKAMEKTTGDVCELGIGVFSTPYLHYQCILQNRKLISYENFKPWFDFFTKKYGYNYGTHEINYVENYMKADVYRFNKKRWSIVFIDQTPDVDRAVQALRVSNHADYVIIHDSGAKFNKQYHYDRIYPFFKYRTDWTTDSNNATVLSNFVDLKDFWK